MSFPISKRLTFLDFFSYMQFSRYMFLTDALSVIRKLNFFNPLITGKTSYHNSTSLLIWVVPIFSTQMESHRNSPVLPGVIRKLNFFNPLITGKTSYHNSTSLLIWVVPIFSTQMESHRNSPVLPGPEYPYLFYIIELFPVLF